MKQMAAWNLLLAKIYIYIYGIAAESQHRQNQRNGTSREIGIWWSVTRSILQSSYRGDFLDELEVEDLRERFTEMQATELVIKTRSSLTIPVRCIKRKFLRICKQYRNLKTFFISGSSGLGKSRFAKDLARRITIINARVSIQFILLQRAKKMERHMISLIQSMAQDVTSLMTSMQHHLGSRSS